MTIANPGPTPSPTSNQLIALAEEVLAGRVPAQALAGAVAQHLGGLEQAQRDFSLRLAQLQLSLTDGLKQTATEVHAGFRDYREALESLRRADDLRAGIARLTAATSRMLAGMGAYELQELIAIGPTTSPYVNLLTRLARQLEAGQLSQDAYVEALLHTTNRTTQTYGPLLAQAGDDAALRKADAEHAACVSVFHQFATDRDWTGLQDAAQRLEQVMSRFNELLHQAGMNRLGQGASRSPHVNLLRNALQGFSQGALPLTSWDNAVQGMAKVLRDTRAELDGISADTPAVREDVQRARTALQALEAFMAEAAACRTPSSAQALLERFDAFSSRIEAVLDIFSSLQKLQEGKVLCVHCQHPNPRGAVACERCNARLLRTEEARSSGFKEGRARDMPLPPPLRTLLEAVNAIADGRTSPAAFLRAVDDTERAVDRNQHEVAALAAKQKEKVGASTLDEAQREAAVTVLERALGEVLGGSTAIRHGLQRMRGFVHDGDREALKAAVRQVYDGFRQLYEVHLASKKSVADADTPQVAAMEGALFEAASDDWSVTVSSEDDEEDGVNASALLRGLLGPGDPATS